MPDSIPPVTGVVAGSFAGTTLWSGYSIEHVPDDFVLQIHRGAGALGPENTLESCLFAWSLGTIPEVDVRFTRDGVMVPFHDENMKRVVSGLKPDEKEKGVEDFSYAELLELDVGIWCGEYFRGQRIPMMVSIFSAMKGHPERRIYLDIKEVSLEQLSAMVTNFGIEKQVIFATTHYDLIKTWKELLPAPQTLLWMGGDEETLTERMAALREEGFAGITQLQVHARISDLDKEDPFIPSADFFRRTAEEMQRHGILFQSLPWGTSEPRAYWKLLDLGVESFASDYPQQTLQAVSDYYNGKSK